jgi:hypothetical protein
MPTLKKDEETTKRLRDILKPGSTVYTKLTHVARSGMTRWVELYIVEDGEIRNITHSAASAAGMDYDNKREAIRVSGCGFNACSSLVYELGWALYPEGFTCIGEGCPSSEHVNSGPGRNDYTPHLHARGGGYALKQRDL